MAEASFVERAGVDGHARQAAVAEVVAACAGDDVTSLRLSFVDQHGLLRGKTFAAAQAAALVSDGAAATGSLLAKDTGNRFAFPLWTPSASPTMSALVGAKDVVMLPDPTTFARLPWTDGAAWMLCDLYTADAEPVVLSTRRLLREALARLDAATGLRLRAGIELELHLYQRSAGGVGTPEPVHPGWDLLAEGHADLVEPHLEPIRTALTALGHEPRSIEIELGPGQVELTFDACDGLAAADRAVLARSAIRQVARRHGLHATFMSRPGVGDAFPSGWHLHQSLVDANGANTFAADGERWLSPVGERWLAGLLAHADASCLLTTPTITGYKRYRPNSVAPDRITWGVEHRGAMLRLIDGRGANTHVENRVGDPAANPYLYLASQIVSGLDGIESKLPLGPPEDSPYEAGAGRRLPRSLAEAIVAFEASPIYRQAFGEEVVGYLSTLARSSWDRFAASVTDWEQREYFELF